MNIPRYWVILGPDGRVLYSEAVKPPPDFRYPKGSKIAAPGDLEFSLLEGGRDPEDA